MVENTKIEWADHTFNPWVGCQKISPACDHCYAESWAKRAGNPQLWQGARRRTTIENWQQPFRWNDKAQAEGVRRRVFCASLADVFDNVVEPQWRADLFAMISRTEHLDWLLLTKRIGNASHMISHAIRDSGIRVLGMVPDRLPNVWIGATVANQEEVDRDLLKLLKVPALVRFLSIEPMLGPINLGLVGTLPGDEFPGYQLVRDRLHWVIAGGESGGGARPMHPTWPRQLRNECNDAGVAFLFKQWGEWEVASLANGYSGSRMPADGKRFKWLAADGTIGHPSSLGLDDAYAMGRGGKAKTGRVLDGRTWDEFPRVA